MPTPRRTEPAPRNRRGETRAWLNDAVARAEHTFEHILFPFQPGRQWPNIHLFGNSESLGSAVLILSGQPRPDGMVACHLPDICNNGRCANVAHVRWDTPEANNADMHIAGTIDACRGEKAPSAVLTFEQVTEIKAILSDPDRPTYAAISAVYDVSVASISGIRHGRTWTHVPWPDGTIREWTKSDRYVAHGRPNATLSVEQVTEIKAILSSLDPPAHRVIGDRYGVSKRAIRDIKYDRAWSHVPWPEGHGGGG